MSDMSLIEKINSFISHMVQMKEGDRVIASKAGLIFISHMVQMKELKVLIDL